MEIWISVDQAARLARVSRRTIHRWIEKRAVRVTRPSPAARRVLIHQEDVDPNEHYKRTATESS